MIPSHAMLLSSHPLYSSRRLLLHHDFLPNLSPSAAANGPGSSSGGGSPSFDTNLVMILAVLLCALICALGLNAIVRCALRCSNRVAFESGGTHHQSGSGSVAANAGIKRAALKEFPTMSYSQGLAQTLPGLDSKCAICLCDFATGARVRVLPRCNHGFHVRCIDKWLASHSSCPTCRQCLLDVRHKIASCGRRDWAPQPVLVPLDPEGLLIDYRA
ncbi:hypothetical protein ACLOJK_006069 [Asimina triloba]